ncbi:pentapeptide repeat-containing protein, partial [Pseudanabaena sp. 'Roaring Creek']|uniref:pentapeptide repeat-containing protein n=1 Tax=Pseudanabaena sp. 'Roaring Creek' TaxID=1681830 RepID=UPI0006D7DDEB
FGNWYYLLIYLDYLESKTLAMKYRIFFAIALLILLLFPLPAWAANPSQVILLQTTQKCQGCDLTGAYLPVSKLDYSHILASDLSRANLVGSSITFSNLSRANLTEANLSNVNLKRTKMLLTNFTNAILHDTNLTEADLTSSNISESQLANAKLCKTTLPSGLISNRDC